MHQEKKSYFDARRRCVNQNTNPLPHQSLQRFDRCHPSTCQRTMCEGVGCGAGVAVQSEEWEDGRASPQPPPPEGEEGQSTDTRQQNAEKVSGGESKATIQSVREESTTREGVEKRQRYRCVVRNLGSPVTTLISGTQSHDSC